MDNDCLLRNDFWKTVRSFAIAEELLVWEVDLSIGNRFLCPQVTFSDMERLSSCAKLDMMVSSSSPLPSKV